ncbi:endoribonuclease Dicer homolog 3b-like [Phoenix dactylifera]|uniref:Endoribonuclease Dicer homolog 3b-like n=1 Tax=Phoenix dactylifera TaxID=42345 RepID=A0A8B8ZX65_PHODC|nr:endoribonuclease Dicer homolog 3b-like [Phoenix dactylifera]
MDSAKEVMEDKEERPSRRPTKAFQPRSYQIKVFEVAMQRNTIAVLETGAGKTMIAVMLIKEIGRKLIENGKKMFIFFLAPTVNLVNQQYEVIRDHTEFDVAEYYGAKKIGEWSAEFWKKEVGSRDVVMMTPQILLDALKHAFLTLDMVNLIIFDECHRATGNHPYAKIMKEFYHKSGRKPAIFGMSASPVVRKGVSSAKGCEEQISELESILDSKVYTVKDRAEVEAFAPSAKMINIYYDATNFNFQDMKIKLEALREKVDASLVSLQESPSNQFKDTNDILMASRKSLSRYHGKILYCLDELGLICAAEAAKVCIENVHVLYAVGENEFSKASFDLYIYFLEEVLHTIKKILPHDYEQLTKTESNYIEATKMGLVSPKLDKLVHICQSFGSSKKLLCLIFIQRIIAAKVIERFMKMISKLSHFAISYLTGGNSSKDALSPKMQKATLDMFRAGKVNILFTTDVAEEGIHVPNCSCVVRFDLPKTVRSYVQSRGRARQSDSRYVLMIERGNTEQRDHLFDIIRGEFLMTSSALYRYHKTSISKICCEHKDVYCVGSTGATVTADSSVNLIYKYCDKLPKDRYFIPQPSFQLLAKDGLFECTLTLPPNAAFQRMAGPLSTNSNLAKQLVSLEACKKLHELGALSDHLLPFPEEPLETDIGGINKDYASGAGTTKRKELHGMISVRALSGTWAHRPDNVTLNAYKINFVCDQEGENYSGFFLFIEAILDADVARANMELFLIPNKVVKTSISPSGKIQLNADQVEKSKLFQEFFFNGLFGKLFSGSRVQREFLFRAGHKISWSSLNMYLLLPLESSLLTNHGTLNIHWKAIDACASVVNYLGNIHSINGECCSECSVDSCSISYRASSKKSDIIHLANKSLNTEHVKDSVVLSIHTGRIYSVLDVLDDTTTESPFDESFDAKPSQFASFIDYYYQKYNIVLKYPGQPLLLLKQSHNPHNLLFSKSDGSTGQRLMVEKEQVHARIPAELLVHIDISTDILKSFYLLPSVMHRLESLMLASQLREEIGSSHSHSRISSSLILEAITTLRCCENFSLERLELLGDSVLKYIVSCHLFLRYPKKHEGQLSDHRSWATCNSTLHKLGTGRSLQGYIRDRAFDPRRWVAPGQISLRPIPCICGIDTSDVPVERRYMTEDTSVVVGKACDKGHRWMCSKTIADCVEALIGAYYVGGGLSAVFSLMRWLGIDVKFETTLVKEAKMIASRWCYLSLVNEIEMLESKLNYRFSIKGLLLEAITHPSRQELGLDYCYQRLEFLGDSVLDLLITWHLFINYRDIDPGELTDLRSASVNNEYFSQAAVRHNFQQYLQHGSGILLGQITDYVKYISENQGSEDMLPSAGVHKSPKVLGDIVESIAGAILIDTELNLDMVWWIFQPILSPIITPDKLELPPLRKLIELCSYLGYFINTKCIYIGEEVAAELAVQLKDELLEGHARDRNRKAAKAQAAACLLKDLEKRGISHTRYVSRRERELNSRDISFHSAIDLGQSAYSTFLKENCYPNDLSRLSSSKLNEPVILPIKMQKGGPRTALFNLCKILQWPLPKFESTEEKFRTPIILNGVTTPNFNSFTSSIMLHIPNTAVIRLVGEQRTDKKSAQDSAALVMLLDLEKQGICAMKEP